MRAAPCHPRITFVLSYLPASRYPEEALGSNEQLATKRVVVEVGDERERSFQLAMGDNRPKSPLANGVSTPSRVP